MPTGANVGITRIYAWGAGGGAVGESPTWGNRGELAQSGPALNQNIILTNHLTVTDVPVHEPGRGASRCHAADDRGAGHHASGRSPAGAADPAQAVGWRYDPGAGRAHGAQRGDRDRKSTRLNSSHVKISYAVFCLKKKKPTTTAPLTSLPARRNVVTG